MGASSRQHKAGFVPTLAGIPVGGLQGKESGSQGKAAGMTALPETAAANIANGKSGGSGK
jgi:hypothetical protein